MQALIFLVVYIFSPELFAISDIFSPLFSFIAQWIQEKEKNGIKIFLYVLGYLIIALGAFIYFLYVLGYLIIALGAFIYNEIIVCNFCGLNQNTWKAIDQKAYDDWLGRDTRDSFDIDGDYIVENNGNEKDDNMVEMN